jgi:type II secretory pathway pseudopilin PulG
MKPDARSAVTLIEMLFVIAIIVMLSGMLLPLLQIARKEAQKAQTKSVLHQVDSALKLFKQEYGVYPYQQHYPDLSAGDTFDTVPNHLGYNLGTEQTTAAQTAVMKDMATAASCFAYNLDPTNWNELAQPSLATFKSVDAGNGAMGLQSWQWTAGAIVLNRMAQDRARLAMFAGDLTMTGTTTLTATGAVMLDHAGTVLVPAPQSLANPGWAADYLHGQIESKYLRSGTILDGWGHGLVYICQVIPAIHGTTLYVQGTNIPPFDPRYWGLGCQGFDQTTGPGPMLKTSARGLLLSVGRIHLNPADAGDGHPPPQDASYLPNNTTFLHSDVRYSAGPGFEDEFELWSSGPDGQFDYWRDGTANGDNIAVQPYCRDIH